MRYYMDHLPSHILETVAKHFNCEDIAMSLLISSMTEGQAPLLADNWAMSTMIKLKVDEKISGGKDHKKLRDGCVDSFAHVLGLKGDGNGDLSKKLKAASWIRKKSSFFQCGADEDDKSNDNYIRSQREMDFEVTMLKWKSLGMTALKKELGKIMSKAGQGAYEKGLLGETSMKSAPKTSNKE
jgi:hypothetical protein